MDWYVIEGVKPWDGRYQWDPQVEFTTREWTWIKKLTGYMPLTVEEGFDGGDPQLFVAFVVLAMRRAGKVEPEQIPDVYERLADEPLGDRIRIESSTGDASPPPTPSSEGNGNSSGPGSPASSETSASPPKPSGTPVSASSASRPPWSET